MAKKRILIIATELTGELINDTYESLRRKITRILLVYKCTKIIAYRGPSNQGGHQTLYVLMKNMPALVEKKYEKIFNILPPTGETEAFFLSKRTVTTNDVYDEYDREEFWKQVKDINEWQQRTTMEDGDELIVTIVDYMILNGVYVSENQISGDKKETPVLIPGDSIEFDSENGEIIRNDARLKRRKQVHAKQK